MITKGIIERVEGQYSYKVRIPIIDKIAGSATGVTTDGLASATVCCSPGCKTYFSPGDVVFLAFEELKATKPVIIGLLYREDLKGIESQTVIDTTIINSNIEANLPTKTTIGDVSPEAIQCIDGARNNLLKQIDSLEERLSVFDKLPRETGDYKLRVSSIAQPDGGSTFKYTWVKM